MFHCQINLSFLAYFVMQFYLFSSHLLASFDDENSNFLFGSLFRTNNRGNLLEPSIYKLTARARASSQFATHSPYAHAHVVYWSSWEPGAPSAHAPIAHLPSREPYPRDITGAAEGPSARE